MIGVNDKGEIRYGNEEDLVKDGFTEKLTDDEAKHLSSFPVEQRKQKLHEYRLNRVKNLEKQIQAKEDKLKKIISLESMAADSDRQIKLEKREKKRKRKQVKKSRRKNRK